MHLRCGGIFNDHFIANFLLSLTTFDIGKITQLKQKLNQLNQKGDVNQ